MEKYIMSIENFEKVNNKWVSIDKYEMDMTLEKWKTHILGSRQFFKSLGGTEVLKGRTLISTSPDGEKRTIRRLRRVVR